jgi:hypothetical protein
VLTPQTGAKGGRRRSAIVTWLEESKANQAVVANEGTWVYVGVRHPEGALPYLQTYADKTWRDNLLALPNF